MKKDEIDLLTVTEAAELLRVSKPTIRALIKDGKIGGFAVGEGAMMRIPKSTLMAFIKDGLSKTKQTKEGSNA
jgi:excisionase family DNA binding protein|tara:strand:- start:1354 stop:1572 length:219 start_codon:yes stop_codon:yes gene_type:complete